MRSVVRFSRISVRCVFAVLFAACLAVSAHSQTTTFAGTVYSPCGPDKTLCTTYAGDPIPNILVFVQDSFAADALTGTLPVFTQGVTVPTSGTGCDAQQNLVPKSLLGSALTQPNGTFSFTTSGTLPDPVVIVVQAGKWRRQYSYPLSSLNQGGTNAGLQLVMPSTQIAGPTGQANIADLPHIAVVTGSADQVECIFEQIGINTTAEITNPTGTGSINLFKGDGSGGSVYSTSSYPKESQLLNSASTSPIPMTNYDLVIFGCQGQIAANTTDPNKTTTAAASTSTIQNYTNDGGRVLLTHYEWPFVNNAFPTAATWYNVSTGSYYSGGITAISGTLDPTYSGFSVLEGWMSSIGALTATTPNATFGLPEVRQDVSALNAAIAESWAYVPSLATTSTKNGQALSQSIQFSFLTPVGQSGTPSVAVTYTNNTTQFVRGDASDSITINVTNNGTVATSGATLTLQLSLPSAIVNPMFTDSTGGWSCSVVGYVATCTHPAALNPSVTDSILMKFGISSTATPGQVSLSGTVSGGNLNSSEQCGRVLFNDYHVENPTSTAPATYSVSGCPKVASTGLTAAQKFLEYSLYALSNFVSPAATEVIQIVAKPTVTWTPTTPVYYGTPLATMETPAPVAEVPGTFTYTYSPNTGVTPLDVASYTFTATFTPTDTTDYLTNSASAQIVVQQDITQSIIGNLTGAPYYGQEIGNDPKNGSATLAVSVKTGYTGIAVTGGTDTVTLNGTTVCTYTQGTPPAAGNGPGGCADAPFSGLNAGTYTFGFSYGGTVDFSASSAGTTSVSIQPDPTSTTVTTSNASVAVHSNVTFTASTADTYTPAVGTIVFYDSTTAVAAAAGTPATPNVVPYPAGATLIGTLPLVANGTVTLSLANLTVGTHNILACFVGPLNSSSTYNYVDSCSASVAQVITVPPTAPLTTQTLLVTSVNPGALGQAVSFTATVATTGALSQVPTGTVSFTADGAPLATATVAADGTAAATTSTLALGTHAIVATYGGSSTMATSVSSTLSEVIEEPLAAAGTGFLLQISPTTVPVSVGGSAVVTIQVVELTNFNQQVGLTCSGLPDQSSCVFAQSTIPSGGGTTQLLITAAAPHNCNSSSPYFISGTTWGWPLFGMSMLTLFGARKRKKLQAVALVAMLVALSSTLSGCGGTCTDFGVKPGNYSFTITATSKGSPSVVKSQAMTMNAHL